MAQWFSGDVIANGIRLHYHRTGGDRPPLVLAHGFTDNGLCWTRVARELEASYDVILYDARGHGFSDAPETGYSYENYAADLADLVQALGLQRPRVMGHSMGAGMAATAAAMYLDLLACVILEDPPWRAESQSPEDWAARAAQRRAAILENKTKTRIELIAECWARNPGWHEDELGPWAEAKLQLSPHIAQLGPSAKPWREIVPQVACPILLITADPAKGGIVTPETAKEAASLWREGRVVHIEGAGHSIHRDRFEAFIAAVKGFLAEVDTKETAKV